MSFAPLPIAYGCTTGIVPYVLGEKKDSPLFIIKGGIIASMLNTSPRIWGVEIYSYNDFPWPEGKKVTEEACREEGEKNSKLQCETNIYEKFLEILGKEKK